MTHKNDGKWKTTSIHTWETNRFWSQADTTVHNDGDCKDDIGGYAHYDIPSDKYQVKFWNTFWHHCKEDGNKMFAELEVEHNRSKGGEENKVITTNTLRPAFNFSQDDWGLGFKIDYNLNPAKDGENLERMQGHFAYKVDDKSRMFARADMKRNLASVGGSYSHDEWTHTGEIET